MSALAMRWSGLHLRARLTAVYGLTFVLCVGILLAVAYALTAHALRDIGPSPAKVVSVVPPNADGSVTLTDGRTLTAEDYRRELAEDQGRRQAGADAYRSGVLSAVLEEGSLALVVVTPGALALCWLATGRTLRPLQRVTVTAREIAATPPSQSLSTRIELDGPQDEVRELGAAFNAMLAKLDASFAAQRRFVANAAHELRTPLAIDRTVLEVSLQGPETNLPLIRQRLLATNHRQSRILEGLLALARAEHAELPREPVEFAAVVLSELAAVDGATIRVEKTVESAVVDGVRILLGLLVRNLVSNALRYNVPDGWARVELSRCDNRAVLAVANSGPVIAAADAPLLFEPFRRAAVRTDSDGGTGLGLSIVRAVAQAHGGDVTATAFLDGGLSVEVRLPLILL